MIINKIKRKVISVFLATAMVCSFASFTVYADPDGDMDNVVPGDTTGGDTVDPPANNDTPNVDPPADNDTPNVDPPANNDTPNDNNQSSDNQNNNYQEPDYNNDNNTDNYVEPPVNYDADYYNNYYNSVDNTQQNYTQEDPQEIYDPGMTFNEFERATDYQYSTIAEDDEPAQMYNSNGSDDETLDANDWNDLELNLSKASSDGTNDFSFIKNNSSDQDSNLSILLFVFGIVFVLGSVVLLIYIISSGVRNRKATVSGKYKARNNSSLKDKKKSIKRTPYLYDDSKYDTAQIDISNYQNYNDDF